MYREAPAEYKISYMVKFENNLAGTNLFIETTEWYTTTPVEGGWGRYGSGNRNVQK